MIVIFNTNYKTYSKYVIVPENTKLALDVCYPPNMLSQMSQTSDFTPPISNIIPPCIMNQSGAVVENRINDALHTLSEDL